jgi:hypothetical protein
VAEVWRVCAGVRLASLVQRIGTVVADLRTQLTALALIAGIVAAAGGSVFAFDPHALCAAKQHDCGAPAIASDCCCGDIGAPPDAGAPPQARVDVAAGVAATPVLPTCDHVVHGAVPRIAVQTSPPYRCLVDLTTLFATLLI